MQPASAMPDPIGFAETRPADFHARFARVRRRPRLLHAPQALSRRQRTLAASLLAALALPAFAAPDNWSRFSISDAGAQSLQVDPMPFEQPGSSFPGSAFYYLEADKVVLDKGLQGGISGPGIAIGSAPEPNAFARSLHVLDARFTSTSIDRARALQCLTSAIYYEAASEPDAGQRAVAQVVLNRVAHPSYPDTVCGVVYEGSELSTGCQFSFTCDGSLGRKPAPYFWNRAEEVAREALSGAVYRPVGLATHYHTLQVHPYWATKLHALTTIGAHRFYSFEGTAGLSSTFHYIYAGDEPLAAPHPHRAVSAQQAMLERIDPVALQQGFAWQTPAATGTNPKAPDDANSSESSLSQALAGVNTASPAPAYTAQQRAKGGDARYRATTLPGSSGIKPQYENAGSWLKQP